MLVSLLAGCDFIFTLEAPPRDPGDAGVDDAALQPDAPIPPKHIFASSKPYTGELFGLAGADQECNLLAKDAGLLGTYMAWLSTSDGASPSTRMTQSAGPYELVGGTPIAANWEDLTNGTLLNPIRSDEHGDAVLQQGLCVVGEAWSNTASNGTFRSESCQDWTTDGSDVGEFGTVGSINAKDDSWTFIVGCNPSCADGRLIYCVEQ
jgi:hypothetical protein